MVNPDFVAIANGYQIESERISKRENLKKSIQKMIDSQVAYVLNAYNIEVNFISRNKYHSKNNYFTWFL